VFEGTFKNGEKVHGTLTKEELIYVGDFKEDMAHGDGEITFIDGSSYKGQFAYSQPDGVGVYELANGFVYRGELSGGYFSGWGSKCHTETMECFTGRFVSDAFTGVGVHQSATGEVMLGIFEDGLLNGYGVVFLDGDEIVFGTFKKGKQKARLEVGSRNEVAGLTRSEEGWVWYGMVGEQRYEIHWFAGNPVFTFSGTSLSKSDIENLRIP
jgi:hypothetical protein